MVTLGLMKCLFLLHGKRYRQRSVRRGLDCTNTAKLEKRSVHFVDKDINVKSKVMARVLAVEQSMRREVDQLRGFLTQ